MRARFRHEPIDADDEREPGDRNRRKRRQRGGQRHEPAAGDRRASLRREDRQAEQPDLLRRSDSGELVACAMKMAAIVM